MPPAGLFWDSTLLSPSGQEGKWVPVLRGLMKERPLQSLLARGEVLAFNRRGRWDISEPQVQRSLGIQDFQGLPLLCPQSMCQGPILSQVGS